MKLINDILPPQIDRGPLAMLPATLEWVGGCDGVLRILDQTQLPHQVVTRDCLTEPDVWDAIRILQVRGAPAIGVAAAYGLCLGARPLAELDPAVFLTKIVDVGRHLCSCRPTAVNLAWAVNRVTRAAQRHATDPTPDIWAAMLTEAHAMAVEDATACRHIGELGAALVPADGGVLTHCNAGALATVAYGTALAPLYVAHQRGRRFRVYVDETRPLLQGARLTAFELEAAGIDVTLLCDGAAPSLLRSGRVQTVLVGADRIAANGDTANKVGTYGVALAAAAHKVPLYVVAPTSTFDRAARTGGDIPIEERAESEVRELGGRAVSRAGVRCFNPAFDVTPAEQITGILTEKGLLKPVTEAKIAEIFPPGGLQ
jgi:methylthioribose-1-phosphate isomerase